MAGYVYIVTNHKPGTLYVSVTSNLERRIWEHREGINNGFAAKYGRSQLVWHEEHDAIGTAIQREKSLKRWYRQWKIELIEGFNPDWRDLYPELWQKAARKLGGRTKALYSRRPRTQATP